MSEDLWLGRCAYTPRPGTRIEPVARAENGLWQVYGDFKVAFPPEGKAFAPLLPGYRTGDHLVFQTAPNDRATGRDDMIVSRHVKVVEVIDFRKVDPEAARRTLVERGVPGLLPGAGVVVAALSDGTCVQVRMAQHPHRAVFVAEMDHLAELAVHAFDPRIFKGQQIEHRWIALPDVTVGARVGTVNWCADSDFLESVLKRLRRISGANSEGVSITRTQVPIVVGQLAKAGLLPTSGEDLRGMADRLAGFESDLATNAAAVDEIAGALAALEPVEAAMASRRSEIEADLRAELEPQVRADLEAGVGDLTDLRANLEGELKRLKAGVERALSEASDIEATRDALRTALAEEFVDLQEALAASPRAATQDLIARLSARLAAAGADIRLAPEQTPPWSRARERRQGPALGWDAFGARLSEVAETTGYPAEDLSIADIESRAGRLVVLPQSSAADFVRAVAAFAADGETVTQALDPTCLALDDLWRRPGSGEPTAFAGAWTAARLDPRRFRIVFLDGLQRTPMDLWLPSFADVLDGPERPRNLLVFGSLSAGFIDPDRVWPALADVAVALAPPEREGLAPGVLARAEGRLLDASWFDATAAVTPPRADLIELLQGLSADAPSAGRQLAAFRAAWARTPTTTEAMMAIGDSPSRTRGAEWLRDLLVAANGR